MCAHASGHFAQTVVAMLYSVIVGGDYGGDDDDDGSGSDDWLKFICLRLDSSFSRK